MSRMRKKAIGKIWRGREVINMIEIETLEGTDEKNALEEVRESLRKLAKGESRVILHGIEVTSYRTDAFYDQQRGELSLYGAVRPAQPEAAREILLKNRRIIFDAANARTA
jgi:uncharacterized linocin/CFP29 family protein